MNNYHELKHIQDVLDHEEGQRVHIVGTVVQKQNGVLLVDDATSAIQVALTYEKQIQDQDMVRAIGVVNNNVLTCYACQTINKKWFDFHKNLCGDPQVKKEKQDREKVLNTPMEDSISKEEVEETVENVVKQAIKNVDNPNTQTEEVIVKEEEKKSDEMVENKKEDSDKGRDNKERDKDKEEEEEKDKEKEREEEKEEEKEEEREERKEEEREENKSAGGKENENEESSEKSPVEKVLQKVRDLDSEEGAAIQEVVEACDFDAEQIIQSLIEAGDLFLVKPGKVKVLE